MATKFDFEVKRSEEVKRTHVTNIKFDPKRFNMRWKMPTSEQIKVLANDIKTCPEGQKNPIGLYFVKENGKTVPYVVEGFCRYLAVEQLHNEAFDAGKELPLIKFRVVASDTELKQILRSNIAENQKRFELTPMDMAYGMNVLYTDHKMSQADIADDYNVSQGTVSNYLKLLKLAEHHQDKVHSGELSVSDALVLLKVAPDKRDDVVAQVIPVDATSSKVDKVPGTGNNGGGSEKKTMKEAASQNGVKFKRTIKDFVEMISIEEAEAIEAEDNGKQPKIDPSYFLFLNQVSMWFDGTFDTNQFLDRVQRMCDIKKIKGKGN